MCGRHVYYDIDLSIPYCEDFTHHIDISTTDCSAVNKYSKCISLIYTKTSAKFASEGEEMKTDISTSLISVRARTLTQLVLILVNIISHRLTLRMVLDCSLASAATRVSIKS